MPATKTKLSAKRAQALLDAEQTVRRRRAELEAAEEDLDVQRRKCRPQLPASTHRDDKGKRVRALTIGGVSIRVTPAMTGERFSLKRYKEAGHKITPEMKKDGISPGHAYDRWTVKAL